MVVVTPVTIARPNAMSAARAKSLISETTPLAQFGAQLLPASPSFTLATVPKLAPAPSATNVLAPSNQTEVGMGRTFTISGARGSGSSGAGGAGGVRKSTETIRFV